MIVRIFTGAFWTGPGRLYLLELFTAQNSLNRRLKSNENAHPTMVNMP
jgi:hypothetical protein